MELRILRIDATEDRTIGLVCVNNRFSCYSLEDAVRQGPKVPGRTAIPAGRYQVIITPSQRFGVPLPLIVEVPGFDGIRIHAGNTAADTEGCVLVGLGRSDDQVRDSRAALAQLQRQIEFALGAGRIVWCAIDNVF